VGMRETVYTVITTNSNLATFPGQIHRVRNHIILALASFPDPGDEWLTLESGYLGTSFIPRHKGVGCGLGTGYPSNGFIPRPKKYRERSGNEANPIQTIRQCTHSHTQKVTYVRLQVNIGSIHDQCRNDVTTPMLRCPVKCSLSCDKGVWWER